MQTKRKLILRILAILLVVSSLSGCFFRNLEPGSPGSPLQPEDAPRRDGPQEPGDGDPEGISGYRIFSVAPSGRLLVGTRTFLNGARLTADIREIKVNGAVCAPVTILNETSASCSVSANTSGSSEVEITDSNGPTGFTVEPASSAPTISSISPNSGSILGGSKVTVTGTNFSGLETILIGGVTCTRVENESGVDARTHLTCTTGAGSPGVHNVIVSNRQLQMATLRDAYTYGHSDKWYPLSTTELGAGRRQFSYVWTGSTFIIWGGYSGTQSLSSGALYDPVTDSWSVTNPDGAPSPRGASAVWTGHEMLVWGGCLLSGTGQRGDCPNDPNAYYSDGALYDPVAFSWRPMQNEGAPSARYGNSLVWTGSQAIVFGGHGYPPGEGWPVPLLTGGIYSPETDSWIATSAEGEVPSRREFHTAVWTGTQMIVWGGWGTAGGGVWGYTNTGATFDPIANQWRAIKADSSAPSARANHAALWTLSRMIILGGNDQTNNLVDGGQYDPEEDRWTSVAPNLVTPAFGGVAVWTGRQVIVAGGGDYDPVANSWSAISSVNAPPVLDPVLVWTNSRVLELGSTLDMDGSGNFTHSYHNLGGLYTPRGGTYVSVNRDPSTGVVLHLDAANATRGNAPYHNGCLPTEGTWFDKAVTDSATLTGFCACSGNSWGWNGDGTPTNPYRLGFGDPGSANSAPTLYNQVVYDSPASSLGLNNVFTIEVWINARVDARGSLVRLGRNVGLEINGESMNFIVNDKSINDGWWGLPFNTWTHYVATYNGTTLKLYRNGTLISSSAQAESIAWTDNIYLGRRPDASVAWGFLRPMIGDLSKFVVYNRELSGSEVLQSCNATKARFSGAHCP